MLTGPRVEGSRRRELQIEADKTILVRTLKYDGFEHRRWSARVLKCDFPLLVLDAAFDETIEHEFLGTINSGTLSTEYYWLDRWYNVFRFSGPDQQLKSYYCNVNMPPNIDGSTLSYIDLDIDILVKPDLTYQILDLDDFETNAERYAYPAAVRDNVQQAVIDLVRLIETHTFPFSSDSHGFKTTT